jgi:nicotinate phosphoribosyltransferase
VDTYNTLEGVRHAAIVGKKLKTAGHRMIGIRLDSGDLAYLSIEARKILDDAGLFDAEIVASNNLDEQIIVSLKDQGAKITMWGVGTKLVTGNDEPALGGVFKLGAIRGQDGKWIYKLKLSEQTAKISTPGFLQVRRYFDEREPVGDAIYDLETGIGKTSTIVDPIDPVRRKSFTAQMRYEDLLVPIFRGEKQVYTSPAIQDIRRRATEQVALLHSGVTRFVNPHQYPVGLEKNLYDLKTRLILEARGLSGSD